MTQQWRSVTRLERVDFFTQWLEASERNSVSVSNAPVVARGKDVTWIETPNDHKLGMLIGEAVGFPTQGTNLCKAIIPIGQHTGRQRHGEEAIHILAGTGFIVVDGRRYDFHPGTTIHVPFMSEHQLFNSGDADIEYVTASAMDLDLFVRLGRLEQVEEKGANEPGFEARFPAEDGQFDARGRRIAMHLEDAPDVQKLRDEAKRAAAASGAAPATGQGHGHGHGADSASRRRQTNVHAHGAIYVLMGGGESPGPERNGFTAVSVAMTNIFEEVPHTSSHCHSHTEAVLYVLEGVGFSEVDFEHYDWRAGDAVHVPPKMTRHEHFNPTDQRTRTLRIEFGIRYYYEPLWEGFEKVEHRETAIARP